MKFSRRLPYGTQVNALSELLEARRSTGAPIVDLTESNPTKAGIEYPAGFLAALANEDAVRYEPQPFGLPSARQTIGAEYGVSPERVALTASTSEAYSWIFKLLCDPGDEVLIPRPSYPLFEYLAALESVTVRHYSLFHDHGWFIDFHTLERAITERTRAVVLVNPNNPTGHFIRRHEVEELSELCARRGIAIIADEVFQDYALAPAADSVTHLETAGDALLFRLNGLSKSVGLPQLKLAWLIVSGPDAMVGEALARLEVIADTYLSAGTPVQCALPELLKMRQPVQGQIMARLRRNLSYLQASGLRRLPVEAGWYAIAPLAQDISESLLRDENVLVQPGYFYDFERDGYLVLSLLTNAEAFQVGISAILRHSR